MALNGSPRKNFNTPKLLFGTLYVSKFTDTGSSLLKTLNWSGYDDESLVFQPKGNAIIFTNTGYTSYI